MGAMKDLVIRAEEATEGNPALKTYIRMVKNEAFEEGYKVGHADGYDKAQAEHGM